MYIPDPAATTDSDMIVGFALFLKIFGDVGLKHDVWIKLIEDQVVHVIHTSKDKAGSTSSGFSDPGTPFTAFAGATVTFPSWARTMELID